MYWRHTTNDNFICIRSFITVGSTEWTSARWIECYSHSSPKHSHIRPLSSSMKPISIRCQYLNCQRIRFLLEILLMFFFLSVILFTAFRKPRMSVDSDCMWLWLWLCPLLFCSIYFLLCLSRNEIYVLCTERCSLIHLLLVAAFFSHRFNRFLLISIDVSTIFSLRSFHSRPVRAIFDHWIEHCLCELIVCQFRFGINKFASEMRIVKYTNWYKMCIYLLI